MTTTECDWINHKLFTKKKIGLSEQRSHDQPQVDGSCNGCLGHETGNKHVFNISRVTTITYGVVVNLVFTTCLFLSQSLSVISK